MRTQEHAGRWARSAFALLVITAISIQAGAQGVGYAVSPDQGPGPHNFTQPGYPTGEAPRFAFDNLAGTKYLNFAAPETVAGVVITPAAGATTIQGIRLTAANDAPGRDPLTFTIEGSNGGPNGTFTPLAAGLTGMAVDPGRGVAAAVQNFINTLPFTSYRITFPTLRTMTPDNTNNSLQIAEIELLNAAGQDVTSPTDAVIAIHLVPEPGSLTLVAVGALGLLRRGRR